MVNGTKYKHRNGDKIESNNKHQPNFLLISVKDKDQNQKFLNYYINNPPTYFRLDIAHYIEYSEVPLKLS